MWCGTLMPMSYAFVERSDGIIEIQMPGATSLLVEGLNDSVSSRAPRGVVRGGLSTYWIDRADAAVRKAVEYGITEPFAAGNATYLQIDGENVVAAYEWDSTGVDGERMPIGEFLALLAEWRAKVIAAGGVSPPDAALLADEPIRSGWDRDDPGRPTPLQAGSTP